MDDLQWRDNLANVAACQEDPVVATAEMLGLPPQEQGHRTLSAGGTTVAGAFDAYLGGLGRLWAAEDDSTGHVADAVSLFSDALALDPSFALAQLGLGQAHLAEFDDTGDHESARRAAESARVATKLDDRLAAAHVTLGRTEEILGENYTAAIQEFTRALDIDPVNRVARRKLAEAYWSDYKLALAESTFEKAVVNRPKHWAAHFDLGRFYYTWNRYDDALRVLGEAVKLAPDNPWPYIVIGVVHLEEERFDDACVQLNRVLELEPSPEVSRMVYSNLGTCYFVLALYADAVEMYELALGMDKSSYATWGNLAATYNVLLD
ncbi:MAG: tetratricopeptide repeat protein, partial [Candidatus Eisenbacteria sp.]|nr:tetratricopeptide repeat protein [Candidatus Eisenbacteria bacterium]